VPFMHRFGEFGYVERNGYRLVSLPYRNNRLAMTLVLPDGLLAPLEQRLRNDGLSALLGGKLPLTPGVELTMPKFRFRTHVLLNDALHRLGMTDAFDQGRADFSGISDEQLFVSEVVHDAYVSVGERGTEAAAATGVAIQGVSAQVPTAEVVVDRPFLFAITDQATGAPLFLGRVVDPAQD
jgi:serpin B